MSIYLIGKRPEKRKTITNNTVSQWVTADTLTCFCKYIDKCRRINGFVIINVINRLTSTKFTIVAMPYGKVCLVTFKNLKQTIKQFLEGV